MLGLVIALFVSFGIIYVQNHEIKQLRNDITTLEITNDTLTTTNASLLKQISTNDTLDGILSDEITKIENSFDDIINELMYQPRPRCVTTTTVTTAPASYPTSISVDKPRVDPNVSLWKAYCLATNGVDKQCKNYGY